MDECRFGSEVGDITFQKNAFVNWNIKRFRKIWVKGYQTIRSPKFSYSGKECFISLEKIALEEVRLWFCSYSFFYHKFCFEFQLRTDSIVSDSSYMQLQREEFHNFVHLDFEDFLSKDNCKPLHDDLTVIFRVFEYNGSIQIPDEFKKVALPASEKASKIETSYQEEINSNTINKLLEDLKSLLVSGENSDVKLVVRGKKFPAHRLILSTRSPVFKAMLCHDTSERYSGTVNIDDCDPESFQDFLDYMYTGSTKHVNTGNVISLYTTADKYFMRDLKDVCVSFMKANMSVEKFCGVATLALLHAEKELLAFLKDFFFKNSKKIIDSKKWETFFNENPKEAYEHFMKPLINRR